MTPLEQRQKDFASFLINGFPRLGLPGWPEVSACAVAGNGTQENLCRPVTVGVKDHGSDGVMQWRLSRLTDMRQWCNDNFGRWDTLEAQAAFTMYECRRDYPSLYKDLVAGTKSIETLTVNFCGTFERPNPAAANLDSRIKYAKDVRSLLSTPAAHVSAKPAPVKSAHVAGAVVVASGAAAAGHALSFPWWVTVVVGIVCLAIGVFLATKETKK